MKINFDNISDYKIFFENIGGFHDAEVKRLNINFEEKEINIFLSDPLINFIGTESYRKIELLQMNILFDISFDINIDFKTERTNLKLYDIITEHNFLIIQFSPSGFIKTHIKKIEIIEDPND